MKQAPRTHIYMHNIHFQGQDSKCIISSVHVFDTEMNFHNIEHFKAVITELVHSLAKQIISGKCCSLVVFWRGMESFRMLKIRRLKKKKHEGEKVTKIMSYFNIHCEVSLTARICVEQQCDWIAWRAAHSWESPVVPHSSSRAWMYS